MVYVGHLAHFSHKNIIKYSKRPFNSVEEHDEVLVNNWNAVVSPGDNVYHLGDFAYGNKNRALDIIKSLNGNIHHIQGNHDSVAHQIRHKFIWSKPVWEISVGEHKFFLSHYAHRVWNKSHYSVAHCFGHSHYSLPDDPNSLSMDVGVDAKAHMEAGFAPGRHIHKLEPLDKNPTDYRPFHLDEILAHMKTKTFKPVDHHD